MLTKDDILDAIHKEMDICLHLFGKLPEGSLDYRPTPGQRSTLELLRYISFCGIGGARCMTEGNWDGYGEVAGRAQDMAAEEFPAAMERQRTEIDALFAGLTDDDLVDRTATDPLGNEAKLGRALFDLPLRWLIGYRVQLFLYAKAAGNEDIWTPNCWAGMDWEKPAPVPDNDA